MLSSKMCIINRQGVVYSSTDNNLTSAISDNKDFLANIRNSKNNFFEYNINGSRTIVIKYSTNTTRFSDLMYVAFIPYADFTHKLLKHRNLTYSIIFFSLLISTLTAYLMSKRIYGPIKNLVGILSKNQPDALFYGINEMNYLNNQVKRILSNEDNLKKDLSIVMPLASEQYITKILTSNDFLLDRNVKCFIQNNHVNFKYNCFSVGIVELSFTEKYSNTYNYEEYQLLIKGISKLFNDFLSDSYPIYILNLSKNRIGIIINLNDDENLDHITSIFKNVVELFYFDRELLSICVGIGRIYPDYTGMNQSYNEAIKALTSLPPLGNEKVKVYLDITTSLNYHYSINEENKLSNYLIGCYKEEAITFMNGLIQKIYQTSPQEATIKKFYLNIYNTIHRIIDEKNININELMGKNYIDLPSNLEILSIADINSYVFSLADKLLSINISSNKVDIMQITEYIKAHYHEDIYLEKISKIYNTSEAGLSRLFKESLGIGFHEYLTSLRVAESKKLLLETDISVIKIGEMVGFNTHSTFFRIFKKFEGINPTQYRENNRKLG